MTAHDREAHSAFGVARFSRWSVSPGSNLFDSDILHRQTIGLTIARASRERHLNSDWIYGEEELIQVEMSSAQFGALVSSFGDGTGVPVTIRYVGRERMDDIEPSPRMAASMAEVRGAASKATEDVRRSFAAVEAALGGPGGKPSIKQLREAVRTLRHGIGNLPSNMEFASKSMAEHAENVVTKAKADIEAMVDDRARALGLHPDQLSIDSSTIIAGELTDGSQA